MAFEKHITDINPPLFPPESSENTQADPDELWSIYLTERKFRDDLLIQAWDAKANGITFFASLFSAVLASFVLDSYKHLQPDSGDTTVTALTQISQQLAGINSSQTIPAFSQGITSFQAAENAIAVNVLWFISLILSISAAIGAVVIQQSTRNYYTRQAKSLHSNQRNTRTRARQHVFALRGAENWLLVDALDHVAALLHLAYFLFLAGLVLFLSEVNETVYWASLGTTIVISLLYSILSIVPVFYPDMPYSTPLTTPLRAIMPWILVTLGMCFALAIIGLEVAFLAAAIAASPAVLVLGACIGLLVLAGELIRYIACDLMRCAQIPFQPFFTWLRQQGSRFMDFVAKSFSRFRWRFTERHLSEMKGRATQPITRNAFAEVNQVMQGKLDQAIAGKTMRMLLKADESQATAFLTVIVRQLKVDPHPTLILTLFNTSLSHFRKLSIRLLQLHYSLRHDTAARTQWAQSTRSFFSAIWHMQGHVHDTLAEPKPLYSSSLQILLLPPIVEEFASREWTSEPGLALMARCVTALAVHSLFMKHWNSLTRQSSSDPDSLSEIFKRSLSTVIPSRHRKDVDMRFMRRQTSSKQYLLDVGTSPAQRTTPLYPTLHVPVFYIICFLDDISPHIDFVSDLEMAYVYATLQRIIAEVKQSLDGVDALVADPATRVLFLQVFEDTVSRMENAVTPSEGEDTSAQPLDLVHPGNIDKPETDQGRMSATRITTTAHRERHGQLLALVRPVMDILSTIEGPVSVSVAKAVAKAGENPEGSGAHTQADHSRDNTDEKGATAQLSEDRPPPGLV
ncbi:hypothetical protein K488DRAFT_82898 [Vararia minispora EC-137]|uniref:Uncharacterized protein n=1 Tax=Vararia minispora EC-137 TaxID=1314806 RepID=A0ACB8QVW3_9AGAM|nr:hypothetical protein K488DRAFT_82898 [Vararia minispora EC-137]